MSGEDSLSEEAHDGIAALIETLFATEQRLEVLTAGEVDTVASRDGRTYLLRRAQDQLRRRDAAQHAAAALTMQRQHSELRVLFDLMPAMIWFKDAKNVILRLNKRAALTAGRSVEEIEGQPSESIYPEDAAKFYADDLEVIRSRKPKLGIVETLSRPDGETIWVQTDKVPYFDPDGTVIGLVVTAQDITERRQAEETLRKSEQRFKALFERAAVGVALADAITGRLIQVNQRFADVIGYEREEIGELAASTLTHPDDVGRERDMQRQLNAGAIRDFNLEKRYLRKDGSTVWASLTVSAMWAPGDAPDHVMLVAQDVSERRRLEEQLRQSQKMEAIGTLAGGIAHDFNNMLGVITGYVELAQKIPTESTEARRYLSAVLQASNRAADLVRRILAFSRQRAQERRHIQLRPIVEESLTLLRATIPTTIEFRTELAPDAPVVLADATDVHQVLMNLGTNAWHAMKDRPGTLQVKLERVVVDAAHAAAQPKLRPGHYARISVIDTGTGMDAATLSRIFEPYFTTKAPGEGTGLGLALVHGIMAGHDGAVTVHSQPGEGTVFRLYFPAHAGEASTPDKEGSLPSGHGQRLLLVDDEELLLELGRTMLTTLGYEVEVARHPADALTLMRSDPSRFDLVLTDQTMPGMTGLELAGQLKQIRAGLPVILTTGYSLSLTAERIEAAGIFQVLLKPVSLHALGTAVQAALSATAAH